MRTLTTVAMAAALTLPMPCQANAAEDVMRTDLKPYNVTIRVFDPTKGMNGGQEYVLPVDSPDVEHAIASTTANAASFTRKAEGEKPLPVAFTCVKVEPR